MASRVAFIAEAAVPKELREEVLHALKNHGWAVKPLLADPLRRADVLLKFLRMVDEEQEALIVCLDRGEALCARLAAGHAETPVVALLAEPISPELWHHLAKAPTPGFSLVLPNTADALVAVVERWLGKHQCKAGETEGPLREDSSLPRDDLPEHRVPYENDTEWVDQLASQFRPRLRPSSSGKKLPQDKPCPLDFSSELRRVVSAARELASRLGHDSMTPLHCLAAIVDFDQCSGHELLRKLGVDLGELGRKIAEAMPAGCSLENTSGMPSEEATRLLALSKRVARDRRRRFLTTSDFVEAMATQSDDIPGRLLAECGATADRIAASLATEELREEVAPEMDARAKPETIATAPIDAERVKELAARFLTRRKLEPAAASKASPSRGTEPEPSGVAEPSAPTMTTGRKNEREPLGALAGGTTPGRPLVLSCDPLNPALEIVEKAADSLLEGQIVAFATESMYAIGVDATNRDAVERLYAATGRERSRAVSVLVHSVAQVRRIVREMPPGVEELIEHFWPGPLTLIFRRHPTVFPAISTDDTIGIRIPNHYVALAILSMLGRPVATTGAKIGGTERARQAGDILESMGGRVDVIVDSGSLSAACPSTVLSVVETPYRIVRPGPIGRSELEAVTKLSIVE